MYKTLSIVIVLISACFSGAIAQEKPREFSPYSRFGIGDLADPHFGAVSHLGGIAAAFTDRNQLNADNPASLGALRSTAFEVGVSTKYTTLSSGDQRTRFLEDSIILHWAYLCTIPSMICLIAIGAICTSALCLS